MEYEEEFPGPPAKRKADTADTPSTKKARHEEPPTDSKDQDLVSAILSVTANAEKERSRRKDGVRSYKRMKRNREDKGQDIDDLDLVGMDETEHLGDAGFYNDFSDDFDDFDV